MQALHVLGQSDRIVTVAVAPHWFWAAYPTHSSLWSAHVNAWYSINFNITVKKFQSKVSYLMSEYNPLNLVFVCKFSINKTQYLERLFDFSKMKDIKKQKP